MVVQGLESTPTERTAKKFPGLFPTPRAEDGQCAGAHDGKPDGLHSFVKMFSAPTARDAQSFKKASRGKASKAKGNEIIEPLAVQVQHFPTPSANDWKGSSKEGQRRGQLTDPAMGAVPAGGQLSPDWVEWLMGWPIGWTSLESLPRERYDEWLERTRAGTWWPEEPAIPRVGLAIPHRVQRLTALGNGQVALCAAVAWDMLRERS